MIARTVGVCVLALGLGGCLDDPPPPLQGYVEGDFVDVAPQVAGRLEDVAVARGDAVRAGDALFRLDARVPQAALAEAKAERARVRAVHENLLSGKRPEEIAVIAAERQQAVARLHLAEAELTRQRGLKGTAASLRQKLDAAEAERAQARARVAQLDAELEAAGLAARAPEIAAAAAARAAADAAVERAEAVLGHYAGVAPAAARVEDVMFQSGEVVETGLPVVRLLPPGNVVVRAFLGPHALARLPAGARAGLRCAACAPDAVAEVVFVSGEAAHAPPILYSREHSDKLTFLVELRPDAATARTLRPGQPVEIVPPGSK